MRIPQRPKSECPKCGKPGAEMTVDEIHDGPLYWACLACYARWHRYASGEPARKKAERYVKMGLT